MVEQPHPANPGMSPEGKAVMQVLAPERLRKVMVLPTEQIGKVRGEKSGDQKEAGDPLRDGVATHFDLVNELLGAIDKRIGADRGTLDTMGGKVSDLGDGLCALRASGKLETVEAMLAVRVIMDATQTQIDRELTHLSDADVTKIQDDLAKVWGGLSKQAKEVAYQTVGEIATEKSPVGLLEGVVRRVDSYTPTMVKQERDLSACSKEFRDLVRVNAPGIGLGGERTLINATATDVDRKTADIFTATEASLKTAATKIASGSEIFSDDPAKQKLIGDAAHEIETQLGQLNACFAATREKPGEESYTKPELGELVGLVGQFQKAADVVLDQADQALEQTGVTGFLAGRGKIIGGRQLVGWQKDLVHRWNLGGEGKGITVAGHELRVGEHGLQGARAKIYRESANHLDAAVQTVDMPGLLKEPLTEFASETTTPERKLELLREMGKTLGSSPKEIQKMLKAMFEFNASELIPAEALEGSEIGGIVDRIITNSHDITVELDGRSLPAIDNKGQAVADMNAALVAKTYADMGHGEELGNPEVLFDDARYIDTVQRSAKSKTISQRVRQAAMRIKRTPSSETGMRRKGKGKEWEVGGVTKRVADQVGLADSLQQDPFGVMMKKSTELAAMRPTVSADAVVVGQSQNMDRVRALWNEAKTMGLGEEATALWVLNQTGGLERAAVAVIGAEATFLAAPAVASGVGGAARWLHENVWGPAEATARTHLTELMGRAEYLRSTPVGQFLADKGLLPPDAQQITNAAESAARSEKGWMEFWNGKDIFLGQIDHAWNAFLSSASEVSALTAEKFAELQGAINALPGLEGVLVRGLEAGAAAPIAVVGANVVKEKASQLKKNPPKLRNPFNRG